MIVATIPNEVNFEAFSLSTILFNSWMNTGPNSKAPKYEKNGSSMKCSKDYLII
jgi:hypothetical protein